MTQPTEQKVVSRIYGHGRGWVFSQADFSDLGARSTIDSCLHRLERQAVVRRVIRGVYHYPRHSAVLQTTVAPDVDQTAQALARKFAWRIQPDGATAQNLLGLLNTDERHLEDLGRDYQDMQLMLFTEPPSFLDIVQELVGLEHRINTLSHGDRTS
jgi:uncharacterized protein DUF6088